MPPPARTGTRERPRTIAVIGTSMNSGKTTTIRYLVRGMSAGGARPGTTKVTGTGSGGDYWVMLDAGAEWSFSSTSPPLDDGFDLADHPLGIAPASRHVMGTCRMGDDPRTSVVGPEGRFHDVENLLCADSSVFVTASGYNPTLTLVALAIRSARLLTGTMA